MTADLIVIIACLVLLGTVGLWETKGLRTTWRDVPIRIHVNGTRGKSTTTRLIWAGLRASGKSVVAKTTGTEPRLLLPDGTERSLLRRGLPNIREQMDVLRMARTLGADAVVVECMALRPHLQWVSERCILRSTIGVITNIRTDHEEVMGRSLDEIAASLANTVPRSAELVLGEPEPNGQLAAIADALGTRVTVARPIEPGYTGLDDLQPWELSNYEIALAVTRLAGIEDSVAIPAMRSAPADPGTVRKVDFRGAPDGPPCLDASAANDPESLSALMEEFLRPLNVVDGPVLLVYNHRRDRPLRLPRLLDAAERAAGWSEVVMTGEHPPLTQWWVLHRGRHQLKYVSHGEVNHEIARRRARIRAVVLCGNTRGLDSRAAFGS